MYIMVTWRHLLQEQLCFTCNCRGDSPYIVVGLPMDWTTTYIPGTRLAPQRIREASCNIELYSITTRRSLEDIPVNDLGDAALVYGDTPSSIRRIENIVYGLREDYPDQLYFFLGGEHLVSYPIIRVLSQDIDGIVVFDAHGDLRNEYMGLKYSHATVMRRVAEEFEIPLTIIGVRALSSDEISYLRRGSREGLEVIYVDELSRAYDVLPRGGRVYLSIDMDVVDPGYAPGVSNPEPIGISPADLLSIVGSLVENNKLIAVDLVEVNPLIDVNNVTSILAAKLIIEIIGLTLDGFD